MSQFAIPIPFRPNRLGPSRHPARPLSVARAHCLPRPQRGPGPAKCRCRAPRLGREAARSISAVRADPTVVRPYRANKNGARPATAETLAHSPLSLLSLSAAAEHERASEVRGLGAVAGPLAGERAPQRVSAPPSSGLAAAPLLARARRAAPRLGLLLPARRRAALRRCQQRRGKPPLPLLPLLFASLLLGFNRLGNLGLGFHCARVWDLTVLLPQRVSADSRVRPCVPSPPSLLFFYPIRVRVRVTPKPSVLLRPALDLSPCRDLH